MVAKHPLTGERGGCGCGVPGRRGRRGGVMPACQSHRRAAAVEGRQSDPTLRGTKGRGNRGYGRNMRRRRRRGLGLGRGRGRGSVVLGPVARRRREGGRGRAEDEREFRTQKVLVVAGAAVRDLIAGKSERLLGEGRPGQPVRTGQEGRRRRFFLRPDRSRVGVGVGVGG